MLCAGVAITGLGLSTGLSAGIAQAEVPLDGPFSGAREIRSAGNRPQADQPGALGRGHLAMSTGWSITGQGRGNHNALWTTTHEKRRF
ncbi:hypothetical protein GCM10023114_47640 [Mycolicibacterium sediminis]|uniref:Uncharacterized protein n=1 Tax=Mycolicibacterium sediminis TaxID=1286180 RepID=A0A7I7QMC2_9MYCO|nr:hypothetical protein MSEDJ_15790 [Mycolicibacterium sediminis]